MMILIRVHHSLLCLFAVIFGFASCTELRGVPRSKIPLYDPSKPFTCLDNSAVIAFSKVNDDYCDCRDGSDEPGTSACSNGHYYCRNRGHKPSFIPSSRVNDGICDCCDGTDEYDSWVKCSDTCWEDGKVAREVAAKRRQLLEEGHKTYGQWIKDIETTLNTRKQRLEQVQTELAELTPKKSEMEMETKTAEDAAEKAKSEQKKIWEEGRDRREAEKIFNELDVDSDGKIFLADLQTHSEFDVNADGSVTHDELKEYTEALEEADFATFLGKIWPNIKTVYKSPPSPPSDEETQTATPSIEETATATPSVEAGTEETVTTTTPAPVESPPTDPEYDQDTRDLIDKASKLRSEFSSVESSTSGLENEKSELEKLINGDHGPGKAFFPLADSKDCYEFNDREYTYKLCPFREVEQIQKSGGGSSSLGHYSGWEGPDNDKHSVQMYKDGQGCWNGPNRSTKVTIVCGPKSEVLSASEPSRCEYVMEFATPAACNTKPESEEPVDHDEL